MLDIQSINAISGILAAIGVLVGVVFAILELRNLVESRQTDIVTRIYSRTSSREHQEAWEKVRDREITNYNDYKKNYGFVEVNMICNVYDQVGVLLRRKLVDASLVQDLFGTLIKARWTKFKPLIEDGRKHLGQPDIFNSFEYLYNELQNREQRLQQIQQ